jgi:hypothetical protein
MTQEGVHTPGILSWQGCCQEEQKKGMPYVDLDSVDAEVVLCFVQTIQGNMESYTKWESRTLEQLVRHRAWWGTPGTANF